MKYLVVTAAQQGVYTGFYIDGEAGNYHIDTCNISTIQNIPADVVKTNFTKINNQCKLVCAADRLKYKVLATVLAEIRANSKQGKIIAYDVFLSESFRNAQVVRLTLDKLESLYTSFQSFGNGTFTNLTYVDNSYFRLYPNVTLPVEIVKTRKSTRVAQVPVPTAQSESKPQVKQYTDNMFSDKQKVELKLAADEGLKDLIYNPNLTPDQMRVLWMSKLRGSKAEAYKNPAIPVDSMKWYSNNLKHNLDVQDYKFCLSHPEFTVEQLELYKKCISLDMNPVELGVLSADKLEAQFNAQLEKTYSKATTTLPDFITMERIQQFKKRR